MIANKYALPALQGPNPCQCKPQTLSGLGIVLPVVGEVPTWLLLAVAALAVYLMYFRRRSASRAKAKRIIRRVQEF